jgi:recyclin-1
MDKAIQVLVNQCEYILISSHNLQDYNPPESLGVLDMKTSKACDRVVKCLQTHSKVLSGTSEKNTMEVFFGEVGVRLFK